jgi:hypothetical protein
VGPPDGLDTPQPKLRRRRLPALGSAVRVTRIVLETVPGRAAAITERIRLIAGMGPIRSEGDRRVVGTWTVPADDTLEGLSEALHAMEPGILQVFPTFVDDDG